jgi:hypothetical protein
MILLAAIYVIEMGVSRAAQLPFWQALFGGDNLSFTTNMLGTQLERLVVALLMIVVLLLLGFTRSSSSSSKVIYALPLIPYA